MGKNLNMHMLQLHLVNIALVEICPRRKKDSLNVEYHVTVLLMNIAVATTIKQVGFGLEMDLRVSFIRWFWIFIQKWFWRSSLNSVQYHVLDWFRKCNGSELQNQSVWNWTKVSIPRVLIKSSKAADSNNWKLYHTTCMSILKKNQVDRIRICEVNLTNDIEFLQTLFLTK